MQIKVSGRAPNIDSHIVGFLRHIHTYARLPKRWNRLNSFDVMMCPCHRLFEVEPNDLKKPAITYSRRLNVIALPKRKKKLTKKAQGKKHAHHCQLVTLELNEQKLLFLDVHNFLQDTYKEKPSCRLLLFLSKSRFVRRAPQSALLEMSNHPSLGLSPRKVEIGTSYWNSLSRSSF